MGHIAATGNTNLPHLKERCTVHLQMPKYVCRNRRFCLLLTYHMTAIQVHLLSVLFNFAPDDNFQILFL